MTGQTMVEKGARAARDKGLGMAVDRRPESGLPGAETGHSRGMARRETRRVVLELADEIGWELCGFCRFGRYEGSCQDGYTECTHPLGDLGDHPSQDTFGMEPGKDCWTFRLNKGMTTQDVADIAGLGLQNGGVKLYVHGNPIKVYCGEPEW